MYECQQPITMATNNKRENREVPYPADVVSGLSGRLRPDFVRLSGPH